MPARITLTARSVEFETLRLSLRYTENDIQLGPVAKLGARFHGMEATAYNLQTSTLKTKDLKYSKPLRKCSGQERTNDVTAPNCSGNLASKSTRRSLSFAKTASRACHYAATRS